MWTTIITVGLQVVGWILGKNAQNEEFQKLFYDFVEKIHSEYLNSATMRLRAKDRMVSITNKAFMESP